MRLFIAVLFVLLILIIGCSNVKSDINPNSIITEKNNEKEPNNEVANMKLTSPAFENNGKIPSEYTCDGSDTSPELDIADAPKNAKSLVLINDDPDAPVGTWDHWIIFNIPPTTKKVEKGSEPEGLGGKNSWAEPAMGALARHLESIGISLSCML